MENIKNIIFDLGGVMIDLDRLAAVRALTALGMAEAGELLNEYEQRGPFLALEKGEISAARFFELASDRCGGASPSAIEEAFCRFLVALPAERLDRLVELRAKGYRLYVLSNTNPVMFDSWIAEAFRSQGKRMQDYFDGIVCSYREGTCKPDPAIFQRVLDRYGLKPEETLMLDDSEANCRAAASTGMPVKRIDNTSAADSMLGFTSELI